jgi:hypothetical protein
MYKVAGIFAATYLKGDGNNKFVELTEGLINEGFGR